MIISILPPTTLPHNKILHITAVLTLRKCLKILAAVILFPWRFIFFGRISIFSFISLNSSIRNRKNIFIDKRVHINDFVVLWPSYLSIGAYSQINPGTAIYGKVIIGKYVMIAPNCMLAGANHSFGDRNTPMMFQGSFSKGGIVIEDNVWIGANCVILDGVTIGAGSIIAAGSVVARSVASYTILGGNTAKVVRIRE